MYLKVHVFEVKVIRHEKITLIFSIQTLVSISKINLVLAHCSTKSDRLFILKAQVFFFHALHTQKYEIILTLTTNGLNTRKILFKTKKKNMCI